MKPTIAPLDPGQAEDVARLFHRLWHETQAALQDERMARHRDFEFFRARVTERAARTIVAKSDGAIAGFATWTGGRLNSLFVDIPFQGRGIGGKLCAEAERRLAEAGAMSFELHCIAGNHRARGFYEKLGWRVASLDTLENDTPEGLCRIAAWRMVKP